MGRCGEGMGKERENDVRNQQRWLAGWLAVSAGAMSVWLLPVCLSVCLSACLSIRQTEGT